MPVFDEEIKLLKKWETKDIRIHRRFAEWRRKWRVKGPVEFAHQILKIDPETGGPLTLSEEQKEFLLDVAKRGVRLAVIVAGRGAGKTFAIAVYVAWRIFTHEYWGLSCMGGSAEQSAKIHKYIAYWVTKCSELVEYCMKCTTKEVKTFSNSYASFLSCSGTAARGPHTKELIIDEEAAGEKAGKTEHIKASLFQVSTSSDIHIIKSSTAQYVHGDFLNTLNNAERLGYKKYQWSIAKHISSEDPKKHYQDHNPNNWSSNVPWIPDRNIRILRNGRSNDEWLVEALGGVSISSGLVFNPNDIEACICSRCLDAGLACEPYKEGHCPIIQFFMQLEGVPVDQIPRSTKETLQQVGLRDEGVDWGKVSPCAYTIFGKFRRIVFVLESKERVGQNDEEKINIAATMANKWNVEIIRPDPREWAYNNELSDRGFTVHELFSEEGGKDKDTYIFTAKRFIERHEVVIPCIFEDLIRSLKNLTWDESGKIRKDDDHSFDSFLYGISYYGEMADQTTFWKAMERKVEDMDEKRKEAIKKQREENKEKSGDPDIEIIEDWEDWIRRKRWERDEGIPKDDEFPWGEGVDMWG